MRNSKSICKFACCLAVVVGLASGCMRPQNPPQEQVKAPAPVASAPAYDPLGLPQDTVNIPAQLSGVDRSVEAVPGRPVSNDTTQYQIYRVQLQTYEAYGDGRRGLQVAQEIFDQPAVLDYEVPYFKLRVGEFKTRAAAETYAQKTRTAGYPNALVVTAMLGVQQAPMLYDSTRVPSDSVARDSLLRKNG
jgi:hypothetical protein